MQNIYWYIKYCMLVRYIDFQLPAALTPREIIYCYLKGAKSLLLLIPVLVFHLLQLTLWYVLHDGINTNINK